MKWLNYHHLIYFREIARLGSISKASETLNVGQPALSSQLKKLEENLGVDLFERKNRQLTLTASGKTALEYADKIGELGQELLQVIESRSFAKRIHLSVGSADAIPKHLVSNIVDFAHKKTDCFLTILEGEPDALLRELMAHKIDVILSDQSLGSSSHKNIFSKKILRAKVCAYATKSYGKMKKDFPKSLSGAPGIVPTAHSKLRADVEHFCHLKGIYLDKVAETQDSMLQKILACKGDGVIFLPEFAATQLVREKKLIKLGTLSEVFVEYFLIYSQRLIENPALELILKQDYKKLRLDS